MAIIKFNSAGFVKAVKPGIVSYVVSEFEKELEEKINGVVEEVYKKMQRELPDRIEAKINQAMENNSLENKVIVNIDITK